jgi:heat shock protein HslJ
LGSAAGFFFQDGELYVDLQADSGTMRFAAQTDGPALVGTLWQWQGTQMNDGSVFTPADPANFTLEFMDDGSVGIQADCNRAIASYTLDGSSITILPGPTTLMACPEDSLGSEFLMQLGSVAVYFFQDGELFMDMKFDSGTMRFAAQPPSLVGPVWLWEATHMNDGTVITPDNPASYNVQFMDDGSIAIQADCNNASASYTLDANLITIVPGPSTLMACPEGSLGTQFVEQLGNVGSFFFKGGDLFMEIKFDSGSMHFVAQPSGLAGTAWVVTAYNNGNEAVVGLLDSTVITAEFAEDGTLSGSAGCNNYTTGYETTADGGFSVGPVATTRMLCSTPEGIMEQEQAFIAALETAATYRLAGDTLEMRTADDALALMLAPAQ